MSAVFSEFSLGEWIFRATLDGSSALDQANTSLSQTLNTSANTVRNLKQNRHNEERWTGRSDYRGIEMSHGSHTQDDRGCSFSVFPGEDLKFYTGKLQ